MACTRFGENNKLEKIGARAQTIKVFPYWMRQYLWVSHGYLDRGEEKIRKYKWSILRITVTQVTFLRYAIISNILINSMISFLSFNEDCMPTQKINMMPDAQCRVLNKARMIPVLEITISGRKCHWTNKQSKKSDYRIWNVPSYFILFVNFHWLIFELPFALGD